METPTARKAAMDSKYPGAMDRFLTLPLSDASKKKILWDNVLKLYSLS